MECSRRFCGSPEECCRRRPVFPGPRREHDGKLLWSQYLAPERPALLNNQMMQLAELHRMSGLAMKDIIVRLWPAGPIPSSYFGLVKRLGDALPRVEAVKRSTCIEGARMAFARVKMHWARCRDHRPARRQGPPQAGAVF